MKFDWAYAGVNSSVPRNAGPDCSNYLSTRRHWIECIIVLSICFYSLRWAIKRAKPLINHFPPDGPMPIGKKFLLISMVFTLGLELGFKLSSRSVIYILNPCHITSIIQIYLLIAKPNKIATALFRIHLNYMNGPLLAYLFPEIESRRVALERPTYYIQHGLMFIIPGYLLKQGGMYNAEDITDINWNVIGYSSILIYHFTLLELFAIPSQVNLNHMLCPAILDPFDGPNYRLFACIHQAILCPALCKLYILLIKPNKLINNDDNNQLEENGDYIYKNNLIKSKEMLIENKASIKPLISGIATTTTTTTTITPQKQQQKTNPESLSLSKSSLSLSLSNIPSNDNINNCDNNKKSKAIIMQNLDENNLNFKKVN